jgi:spore maturation protein CgeB
MNIVILGLSITSSWGNGHATTYRSLIRELHRLGHHTLFLEHDKPWYANHRDLPKPKYCELGLYRSVSQLQARYALEIARADCVIVGSYVPEGIAVCEWVTGMANGVTAFYDIDTPVTLDAIKAGTCEYLCPDQIRQFDLYLSFTGGPTLNLLRKRYGAKRALALHCSVDPDLYRPSRQMARWDLGYLGTFSEDRDLPLRRLLIESAQQATALKFAVAGSLYPQDMIWPENVDRIEHLPPQDHPQFYNSQRYTLNVTRSAMIRAGYSPSVRLFEAAACGTPIISDAWPGLETFFRPGLEILIAATQDDVLRFLNDIPEQQRLSIGARARARILKEHTAANRAAELVDFIQSVRTGVPVRKGLVREEVAA